MIRGSFWWTMGLTWRVIDLIGLEAFMFAMYDTPDALHRLMAYLRDDHLRLLAFCETEGLLSLNNDADYVGSGGRGFTRELPQQADRPVQVRDLWGLVESQETVGVAPAMFAEFVLPYHRAMAERFGRVYYGCCEPVDARWEYVAGLPNLHSVSVSPWSNVEVMAEALGTRYLMCRKPLPSMLSTDRFDEDAIRHDIATTISAAQRHGCALQLVMKDLHTTANHPHRLWRWVEICREEITAAGYD